jgi:hypothetical protein
MVVMVLLKVMAVVVEVVFVDGFIMMNMHCKDTVPKILNKYY